MSSPSEPVDARAEFDLADLVRAVARGDQAACRALYERQSPRLFAVALRIVRDRGLAADVLHDSFVQVWRNASRFDASLGSAGGWLTGIVRYRALDSVRRSARELPSDDPRLGDRPVEPEAYQRLERSEQGAALRDCLGQLDEDKRRTILLAYVDGLTGAQIATRTGTPLGTIKSWIRRGLSTLRLCLEPEATS